jgi:hypothetical protein
MHVVRREEGQRAVVVLVVVPIEKVSRAVARMLRTGEALRNSGRYFIVLNCDSLNGLSFDVCGRL